MKKAAIIIIIGYILMFAFCWYVSQINDNPSVNSTATSSQDPDTIEVRYDANDNGHLILRPRTIAPRDTDDVNPITEHSEIPNPIEK